MIYNMNRRLITFKKIAIYVINIKKIIKYLILRQIINFEKQVEIEMIRNIMGTINIFIYLFIINIFP